MMADNETTTLSEFGTPTFCVAVIGSCSIAMVGHQDSLEFGNNATLSSSLQRDAQSASVCAQMETYLILLLILIESKQLEI